MCVCVLFSHESFGPQPCPVIYAVANPVRGLLDRKISKRDISNALTRALKTKGENDRNIGKQTNKKTKNQRYFQHAHFIPMAGVGKRGAY